MFQVLRQYTQTLGFAQATNTTFRRYTVAAAAATAATAAAAPPPPRKTVHLPILDMPAPTPLTAYKVNRIKHVLTESQMMLVVQHNNLNDSQWLKFRKAANKKQWNFTVFPNALFRKAIEGTQFGELAPLLHSTVGIMYTPGKDLKAALDLIKKEERLLLLGMYAEGMVLDTQLIARYLATPPIEQLHGQLLALLTASSSQLVSLLQRNQINLLANLSHHVDSNTKKDEEPPAA